MPTLRSATTHLPQLFSLTGITAQAASESVAVASGARRKTPLSAPAGMIGSLKTNFRRSANDWKKPEGADDVRTAAHLHGRPHLAVHEQQEGDADQQADEDEQAPPHGDGSQRP